MSNSIYQVGIATAPVQDDHKFKDIVWAEEYALKMATTKDDVYAVWELEDGQSILVSLAFADTLWEPVTP